MRPNPDANVSFYAQDIKRVFCEVAPLYVAQIAVLEWCDRNGFFFACHSGYWHVQETGESRLGMSWGEPFTDYATMLTAILDEIVHRAKGGTPTNGRSEK